MRGGSFGTEACAGGRLEWQAWIFATLEGRQGRPGVGLLLGNIRLEGVGGRWVLGVRRWMPLPAATTRSLYRDFDSPFGSPDRGHHDGIVAVAVSAL